MVLVGRSRRQMQPDEHEPRCQHVGSGFEAVRGNSGGMPKPSDGYFHHGQAAADQHAEHSDTPRLVHLHDGVSQLGLVRRHELTVFPISLLPRVRRVDIVLRFASGVGVGSKVHRLLIKRNREIVVLL
jgi:hypothetical protein